MTISARATRQTRSPRKRGDDTRVRIIDETVRCINEEGFPAATAKHVAERAGVTWGVIQYHFGDRQGLLAAVVDDGVTRLVQSLSAADVTGLPLRQRVETVVDVAWDCYRSPTSLAAFQILNGTKASGEVSLIAEMDAATRSLGELISSDPADQPVAEVIWAALRGMALVEMIMGRGFGWRTERRALVEMAVGLLAQREPLTGHRH